MPTHEQKLAMLEMLDRVNDAMGNVEAFERLLEGER
jgi:hypothetical protein